ncbi:MAG TPA: phosphatidate cytidylyltransferase [Bacilli bacterium]|nr:phosphatidate cytidylyltransferase [Bacilli bacterium]
MKTRIISAIVMLIGAGTILYLGGWYWTILSALLAVGGTWELLRIRETKKEFPKFMKIFTYIMVLLMLFSNVLEASLHFVIDDSIMSIFFLLFLLPLVFINDNEKYNITDAFYLIGTVVFLGLAFNLFVEFRNLDVSYILYVALITIMSDTFAYFTGYFVGKTKLCEKISPKKTVEGLVGGTIMGTIIPSLYYIVVINPEVNIILIVVITFLLSLVGQCGDLVFSSIKRYYGKKDYSNMIPGHGGILDRLDSILFVILAFSVIMGLL